MQSFKYLRAEALGAALEAYDGADPPMLKAAGIDVVDLLKEGVATPAAVLSIAGIAELRYIREDGEGARIGCLATLADIRRSELLATRCSAFHASAAHAATPQVRERATIGGNLCQRPRCWYFRSEDFPCLKKRGATCYAVDGENKYHAIFGGGPCHIVHPSNCAPALVALGAQFVLRSKAGERTLGAGDFFVLPSQSLYAENALGPGEVVVEIVIPRFPDQSATIELREKQSFDWPIAIASVARVDGAWRVCLGAVAPTPWTASGAEAVLGSNDITPELALEAGEAAASGATPLSGNAYKVQLVKVAVKRALLRAAGMEVPA